MEPSIISILIILAVVVIGCFVYRAASEKARGFRVERTTTLTPEQALDQLQHSMDANGWQLGHRDTTSLIMSKQERPDVAGTMLLGVISFWLALFNVASSNRSITQSVKASASGPFTTVVIEGSYAGVYQKNALLQLGALPQAYQPS